MNQTKAQLQVFISWELGGLVINLVYAHFVMCEAHEIQRTIRKYIEYSRGVISFLLLLLHTHFDQYLPVNVNGLWPYTLNMYANNVPKITTIAFRPSDKYFLHSFVHTVSLSIFRRLFLYFKFCNECQTTWGNHLQAFYGDDFVILPLTLIMWLWWQHLVRHPRASSLDSAEILASMIPKMHLLILLILTTI